MPPAQSPKRSITGLKSTFWGVEKTKAAQPKPQVQRPKEKMFYFFYENTTMAKALKDNKTKEKNPNGRRAKNKKQYTGKKKKGNGPPEDASMNSSPHKEPIISEDDCAKKRLSIASSPPWAEDEWIILVGPMSWRERNDLQMKAGAHGVPVRLEEPYEKLEIDLTGKVGV
jgi:hypothetical protein